MEAGYNPGMRNILLAACLSLTASSPLRADDEASELPGVKPAAAEAPKAACLVSGPAAESVGCAGAYQKVSDGFLEGYKAMDAWVASASGQVSASAEKVGKIEDQIKENESSVTKLKLDRSKDAKLKLKELDKANKVLWRELEAARREQDALCKGFTRAAAAKVKELLADVTKRLAEAQKAQ